MESINSTCHGIADCIQCTSSKCFWLQISATKTKLCIEAVKRGVKTAPIPTGGVVFPSPLSCKHQNEDYIPSTPYNQNRIGLDWIVGGVAMFAVLLGCLFGILCLLKWIRSRVPRARSDRVRLNAFRATTTAQVPTSPRVQKQTQPMKPIAVTPTGMAAAAAKGRSPQGKTVFVAKINDGGKVVQSVTVTRAQRFETSVQYTMAENRSGV